MKQGKRAGERLIYGGFLLGVLAFLLVFFLHYRPLIVDNMDDWTYISFSRAAVPIWKYWNPSRVLPEILMPACAQAAVWFVMPFAGDYVWSISIVAGVFLSLMITLYIGLFARLLADRMHLGAPVTVLVSALFLVFHFRSWMSPWIASQHMFYTGCITTCFFYLIPALLNIQLVLLMEIKKDQGSMADGEHVIQKGLLIILMYLAVFSNLFSSCILAVYAGYRLLCCMAEAIRSRMPLKHFLKKSGLFLGILAAWAVSVIFELSGGRARNLSGEDPLMDRIKRVIHLLLDVIERMEDTVFYLSAAILVAGLVLMLISRWKKPEDRTYALAVLGHLFCAGVTLLYLILLSASTACEYITRMDVLICAVFHVLIAVFYSLSYIIGKCRNAALAMPLVTFIMAFDVLLGIDTFAQSNVLGTSADVCLKTNRSFVQQILEADQAGLTEMTLRVPRCDTEDNWPYAFHMGGRMVTALKSHDMIDHIEVIHVEAIDDYDTEFGID